MSENSVLKSQLEETKAEIGLKTLQVKTVCVYIGTLDCYGKASFVERFACWKFHLLYFASS